MVMESRKMPLFSSIMALIAILALYVPAAGALTLAYCSSQNTGSGDGPFSDTYQSNGWCFNKCRDDYAYGIVQGFDCWCSNYTPADQADMGECDLNCPGFPYEKCGSKDGTMFGYIALNKKPSGTQGGSQPTSPNSQEPSSAPTTFQTSTTADTPNNQPTTNIQIVTVSGNPVTQIIIYSPTASAGAGGLPMEEPGKGMNTGAIAGGVIGGVALLAAIVGGVFLLLWRRRRQQNDRDDVSGVTRNTSTMSKAGLLQTEQVIQYPPKIATNIKRNSRMMGHSDSDSISPVDGSDRRSSRPYVFDQRLNPSAIMNFENPSRGSFVSMDDSRDYGRTLNVRNPDPEPH